MKTSLLTSPLKEEQRTNDYYEKNAAAYFEMTLRVDMTGIYDRFLGYVPEGGLILDAGSGSGRDTLAFLKRDYEVEAFDASAALCELSTRMTGIPARVLTFQEFERPPRYDGIWACASLLHVPKDELQDAVTRLIGALKPGGALYVSFKHGSGERISEDRRFYLDLDEATLRELFATFSDIELAEIWCSGGEGTQYGKDVWVNAIVLKTPKGTG